MAITTKSPIRLSPFAGRLRYTPQFLMRPD